ncbi:hypothetical protein V2J09_003592 [Rumex salicifolius]
MGNKLGKRRQVVDEKFTRPQGLYPIKDVDYKKLRKLILESKLAPCYSGVDECDSGLLEECPICFLYYPTLNRSRCCSKSMCTECFLQLKNPDSIHPTHCPFCKTPNYAVEYRGVKSKEERGLEQIEEQKVIEAKIRMRQQEVQEQEERLHKRQETSLSGVVTQTETIECSTSVVLEGEAVDASQDSNVTPLFRASQNLPQNQYDACDMDLEDIMVMEAIWLSIQENGRPGVPSYGNFVPDQYSPPPGIQQVGPSSASAASTPSGGLASAIAALAERQQVSGEQSGNYSATTSNVLRSGRGSRRTKHMKRNRAPKRSSSEFDMQRMNTSSPWDWFDFYHGSEAAAEAGTSYVSSNESENGAELLPPPPPPLSPLSPESVYVSGMSDASSNGLDVNNQFSYYLAQSAPLPPPPPPPYTEDGWSVFAS